MYFYTGGRATRNRQDFIGKTLDAVSGVTTGDSKADMVVVSATADIAQDPAITAQDDGIAHPQVLGRNHS